MSRDYTDEIKEIKTELDNAFPGIISDIYFLDETEEYCIIIKNEDIYFSKKFAIWNHDIKINRIWPNNIPLIFSFDPSIEYKVFNANDIGYSIDANLVTSVQPVLYSTLLKRTSLAGGAYQNVEESLNFVAEDKVASYGMFRKTISTIRSCGHELDGEDTKNGLAA